MARLAAAASVHAAAAVRPAYTDFREIAQTLYELDGDLAELDLKRRVSEGLQKFITTARAAYTAA